jgi:hypothetical protein
MRFPLRLVMIDQTLAQLFPPASSPVAARNRPAAALV